jgi:hypothetical protein
MPDYECTICGSTEYPMAYKGLPYCSILCEKMAKGIASDIEKRQVKEKILGRVHGSGDNS